MVVMEELVVMLEVVFRWQVMEELVVKDGVELPHSF